MPRLPPVTIPTLPLRSIFTRSPPRSRPERARSPRVAPLQGAHIAEPGLSARGTRSRGLQEPRHLVGRPQAHRRRPGHAALQQPGQHRTRSYLDETRAGAGKFGGALHAGDPAHGRRELVGEQAARSEEHTSELQSQSNLVCRLLLEKKKKKNTADK